MKNLKDLWRFIRLLIYWSLLPIYMTIGYLVSWVLWGLSVIHPDKGINTLCAVTRKEEDLITMMREGR